MDLFSQIGTQEILMILLVAIIVIGPNKIVEFGKTVGKVSRNIKKISTDMTTSIERELDEEKKKEPAPSSQPVKKS